VSLLHSLAAKISSVRHKTSSLALKNGPFDLLDCGIVLEAAADVEARDITDGQ